MSHHRMRSRRTVLGLLGTAPLAGALAAATGSPATPAGATRTAGSPPPGIRPGGAFDRYVRRLADTDAFSGTVLLAWRGEPTLVRSYQQADKAAGVANSAGTSFALASLTKFFTGLAAVQLAARGKLSFSDTLGRHLDGFPAGVGDEVTVHQLLTHTSGIPDFMTSAAWRAAAPGWTTSAEAFDGTLATLRTLPLAFTPGTAYSYCNSNYFLAGAVVAAASGEPLWDYLPRHVFAPAGMTRTGFFDADRWLTDPHVARNYSAPLAGGQRQDVTRQIAYAFGPSNGWDGAGGAFASATDLLRFARALRDGTLLPTAWTGLAATGKHPIDPAQHNPDQAPSQATLIGYGTEERFVGGQRGYGHTGAIGVRVPGSTVPGGGSTSLTIYPDLDTVAVILSNYFLYPGIGGLLAEQDRIITTA